MADIDNNRKFSFRFQMSIVIICLHQLFSKGWCNAVKIINDRSQLNGKHLMVSVISTIIPKMHTTSNSTSDKVDDVSFMMLNWLSRHYNFTYSIYARNTTKIETSLHKIIGYVTREKCDLIIGSILPDLDSKFIEFTHRFTEIGFNYVISAPTQKIKASSVINQFQSSVWIWLIGSILCIALTFYFLNWYLTAEQEFVSAEIKGNDKKMAHLEDVPSYVGGLLFRQANPNSCSGRKSFTIRLVAAAWCWATFILITYYIANLTSYLTLPDSRPVINSIDELKNRPEVYLVTEKDGIMDSILSISELAHTNRIRNLKKRLSKTSRCSTSQDCVNLVKSDGVYVYTSSKYSLLYSIKYDNLQTGQCKLQISKRENYLTWGLSWGLPKHSPYARDLNNGILRMREAGLVDAWQKINQGRIGCLNIGKAKRVTFSPLTLANFSGLWIVWLVGYILLFLTSFIVYLKIKYASFDLVDDKEQDLLE